MKIEVGKYYKTRDGARAFVEIERKHKNNAKYCFQGYVEWYDGKGHLFLNNYSWDEKGKVDNNPVHPDELIEEWQDEPEPEKIKLSEFYNVIYGKTKKSSDKEIKAYGCLGSFPTKEDALLAYADYSSTTDEEIKLVAVLKSKELNEVATGNRDLIVGEGLDE